VKKEKSHARDPQKINFSIAIHRSLSTELTRWGEDEGRNRNAQIAWVLRQAVEAHKHKAHEAYAAVLAPSVEARLDALGEIAKASLRERLNAMPDKKKSA